ncbi:hypothetical protein [Pseudoclavibacter helvolus]|uniref:hypothetical protein n=1 Tax=Pseudoclavibacter helvolus TaxID=255205 RepID=UPI0024ADBC3B|nr:hypothetical protein [Pseudoclavibacter helvolus]
MSARLILADAPSAQDALIFAQRAARAGADGVRLQAAAGLLRMSTAALAPRGLLDGTPMVLVLRALRSDPELQCDVTVETLTATTDPLALALPETSLAPAWTSTEPPQHGWAHTADVSSLTLMHSAHTGIEAVAQALPDKPGDDVVRKIRGMVWGAPDPGLTSLPRGIAFAAYTFGFLSPGVEAAVSTAGRWTRLSLPAGHVLLRGPVVSGLTPIRRTGPRGTDSLTST